MKLQRYLLPFSLLSISLLFFIRSVILLDPDFGWHIRMGELIQSSGIPSHDPFSYTMPSFPFVDHEWLTNVVLSILWPVLGQLGLALVFSMITVCALLFSIKRGDIKNNYIIILLLWIGLGVVHNFAGIRPQVQSWLLLSTLFYVILNEKLVRKWGFFLPLLFLYWVNAHGSFGAGIVLFALVVGLRAIRLRRIDWYEVLMLFLSVAMTFLNPYGHHVWGELWMQISDTQLRWRIGEWQLGILYLNLPFVSLLSLSLLLVYKYRHKYLLEEIGVYGVLVTQAVGTARHIPLWVIATLPLVAKGLLWFEKDVRIIPYGLQRYKKLLSIGVVSGMCIGLITVTINFMELRSYIKQEVYPADAVQFLHAHKTPGNIFAPYAWGGFLIWQLPQQKLFIDGRMPSWRWNQNPPEESKNAMDDYLRLLSGSEYYQNQFEKYDIGVVLWPKNENKQKNGLRDQIQSLFYGIQLEPFSLLHDLEHTGWKKIYEDNVSVVYQKPEFSMVH